MQMNAKPHSAAPASLEARVQRLLRPDVQGLHAYAVQPSTGMVKLDTMENPFGLPAPLRQPVLFLDGTGEGPVNHAACMSSVAPGYAPPGQALVALNMVDTDWTVDGMAAVSARTVRQMERWFGTGAMRGWRLLRTDRVLRALPRQHTNDLSMRPSTEIDDGLFVAGDHVTDGSIDGAVRSGRLAAEAALRWVSR